MSRGEGIRMRNRTCDLICNATLETQGCSNVPCHDQGEQENGVKMANFIGSNRPY